jgi:ADP-ribose pyrophosphatase YjhB (NUDIX family)
MKLNHIQASVVRKLFEQDGLRFGQLNSTRLPTDQFSYHLRQLIRGKVIEKLPNQTYRLTAQGKLQVIMLKPMKSDPIDQGFIGIIIVISKQENGQKSFVMQTRNKVPYKGKFTSPGDKVYFGESTKDAAKRALQIQTGLKGSPELRSVWHIREIYEAEIVQDKYFYIYAVNQPSGSMKPVGPSGTNQWMNYDQIVQSKDALHSCIEIIESTQSETLTYHEPSFTLNSY